MERYRRNLANQVTIERNARLVIGDKFNVSVKLNAESPGVWVKYGLGK